MQSNFRKTLNMIYRRTLWRLNDYLSYKQQLRKIRAEININDISEEIAEDIQMAFIISTGRTGTKSLAYLFNTLPNVISLHEPKPDFLRLGLDFATRRVSYNIAHAFFVKYRLPQIKKFSERYDVYIESNNRLFSLVPIISEVFKDKRFNLKIVHIVRDGRDVVRSGFSRDWYSIFDPFPRLRAVDFPDDPWRSSWKNFDRFEKICWLWQKKDSIIYHDIGYFKNSITVKFEDIFNPENEFEGLWRIVEFLELTPFIEDSKIDIEAFMKKKINKNPVYALPHWTQWPQQRLEQFWKIAGKHMKEVGYTMEERI